MYSKITTELLGLKRLSTRSGNTVGTLSPKRGRGKTLSSDQTVTRVAMAKRVAKAWLDKTAVPEFRVVVYSGSHQLKNIPGLLKGFRDGKSRIAGLAIIPDLGVKVEPDKITFSSRNKKALVSLDKWLTQKGCETSGIW